MHSRRQVWRARAGRGAAALVLLALASIWPLSRAGTALIVAYALDSPDAVVMLASKEWERLPAAAALARAQPHAAVIITEPRTLNLYNCNRCGERVAWFQSEGVAASRVTVLRDIGNTHDEATAVLAAARQRQLRRVQVVTSPYHTRRALATFRRVFEGSGIAVGVIPAAGGRALPTRWWTDAYDRFYVRYEWAAILKYRLFYGVPVL